MIRNSEIFCNVSILIALDVPKFEKKYISSVAKDSVEDITRAQVEELYSWAALARNQLTKKNAFGLTVSLCRVVPIDLVKKIVG